MSSYCYEAVDSGGTKTQGMLDVADQSEALRRIKEMGLFPTRIAENRRRLRPQATVKPRAAQEKRSLSMPVFGQRVRPATLAVFTRQLATLVEAGMPLLRGLRTLEEQEENPVLKKIIAEIAMSIENGSSLSEALMRYPKVFNALYTNMTRAGEISGALETTLRRLADFMEKAQKIKGKVVAAMFYPVAVLFVAMIIVTVLMVFVVPRFKQVFDGLLNGQSMPAFTLLVLHISEFVKNHVVITAIAGSALGLILSAAVRTRVGRRVWDRCKLKMPILGPVFRKVAISRFSRTLGTLLNSGVPVLQALTIVKETAGNVIVGSVISTIHDSVKEGETISAPLKASRVFPAMVAGMVDIGEQTGALPDMLMKIADNYDDEVDNAVSAMTSLLEPIMIVLLAVIVGSIVIALFLPLITIMERGFGDGSGGE
jgi:type IV pilus assembly protein PilC